MACEPMNEEGYQTVAGRKNNDDMTMYVRRVISHSCLTIKDESALQGFVPYYSGVTSVQSLARMKEDLRSQGWIEVAVNGSDAPFTEDGYQAVAVKKDTQEMLKYANRFMANRGMSCEDQGRLTGFLRYYSGEDKVQSLEEMKRELNEADWVKKPAGASDAADQPWWKPDAMCGDASAADRAKWLMDNQGKSLTEAREQVRSEFPAVFGIGGPAGTPGASTKFGETFSTVPYPGGGKHKLRIEVRPKDGAGVTLVAIHYTINGKELNFDITHKDEAVGAWVHETPQGAGYPDCPPGTTIQYWLFMVNNGLGEQEPQDAMQPSKGRLTVTV